jgi:hypothetical protein
MSVRGLLMIVLLACLSIDVYPQFAVYNSIGYGYHNNPLYNYQKLGDQLKQSYTEINYQKHYESSQLGFGYIGGLMIFNKFEERNYYEHKFIADYKITYKTNHYAGNMNPKRDGVDSANISVDESEISISAEESDNEDTSDAVIQEMVAEEDTTTEDEMAEDNTEQAQEVEESDVNTLSVDDSTDSYLDLYLQGSARHDKYVYKEFNNIGIDGISTFRFMISDNYFLRICNDVGYRNYNNLRELSNVIDQLFFQIGNQQNKSFQFGATGTLGYKVYTVTVYDTNRFEQTRTFTEKKTGTGKPGAKLKVYSNKQILTRPQQNGTWQTTVGIFSNFTFDNTGIETSLLYRYNPKTSVRYLAQYANTSILTEDIYTDHFSYQGPEVKLRFKHLLPLKIQLLLDIEYQTKTFGAPALNLIGETIAGNRKDIRSSIEIYMSKYINLVDGYGMDLYMAITILRNQSNDNYNDYSLYGISGGVGIGF